MKQHKNTILTILLLFVIAINIWFISYDMGYVKGGAIGYEIALDTVNSILDKNTLCDTCVSKLTIVSKYDTNIYFISNKLIK